jgi:hypothetical protein
VTGVPSGLSSSPHPKNKRKSLHPQIFFQPFWHLSVYRGLRNPILRWESSLKGGCFIPDDKAMIDTTLTSRRNLEANVNTKPWRRPAIHVLSEMGKACRQRIGPDSNRRTEQMIEETMLLACILEVSCSYLDRKTYYSWAYRGFPQSPQANNTLKWWCPPRYKSFPIHYPRPSTLCILSYRQRP